MFTGHILPKPTKRILRQSLFDGIGSPHRVIAAWRLRLETSLETSLGHVATVLSLFLASATAAETDCLSQLAPPQYMAVAGKTTTPDARYTPSVCRLSPPFEDAPPPDGASSNRSTLPSRKPEPRRFLAETERHR